MRAFGGFKSGDRFFYGEVRGDEVHALARPYWIDIDPTGEVLKLAEVHVDLPVAPSKLIAVGLNYADHIAEMKRTPLGTPLIWFKAPSSLLQHHGKIEIAFPEHQTDFELELAIVVGATAKNVTPERALNHVCGHTIGLAVANRSTPTRRWGRLYMPMSMLAISPSSSGKMVKSNSAHAPSR
jgi:2-keto-4-pentenoate hydratase/2-oxohepta-3-ene-1,7-dioic acid hydratase in catechol pathway